MAWTGKGTGTQDDPFQVTSFEELFELTGGNYMTSYAELQNDLDWEKEFPNTELNTEKRWHLGTLSSKKGSRFKIKNLRVSSGYFSSATTNVSQYKYNYIYDIDFENITIAKTSGNNGVFRGSPSYSFTQFMFVRCSFSFTADSSQLRDNDRPLALFYGSYQCPVNCEYCSFNLTGEPGGSNNMLPSICGYNTTLNAKFCHFWLHDMQLFREKSQQYNIVPIGSAYSTIIFERCFGEWPSSYKIPFSFRDSATDHIVIFKDCNLPCTNGVSFSDSSRTYRHLFVNDNSDLTNWVLNGFWELTPEQAKDEAYLESIGFLFKEVTR